MSRATSLPPIPNAIAAARATAPRAGENNAGHRKVSQSAWHRSAILSCLRCRRFLFLYHVLQEVRVGNEVNTAIRSANGSHGVAYALNSSGDTVEADFVSLSYTFREISTGGDVLR